MKHLLKICSVFVCAGIILLFAQHIFAQVPQGLDLTLSPSLMDLSANPGDTLKETFRIRNNGDTPVTLSIIVNKLDPHSRNGEVVPVAPQPNDPSVSWIFFQTTSFIANPKEWVDVPFTITVPKTAAFGYYYAFRIGPTQPTSGQNGATAKLLGQIVLPVLLNVASANAKADVQLVSFTPQSFFNEYLPVTFNVKLTNKGNIAIKPSGTIFIDVGNNNTASLDMNPESGILLPGAIRTYQQGWTDGFLVQQPVMEDGTPKLDQNGHEIMQLVINWNKLTEFRIGKYTATALVVYDNGQRDVPLEATTTFWVFPYTSIGILLAAIILLFLALRYGLKAYITHEVKKQQK